jgi:hypothetical protein
MGYDGRSEVPVYPIRDLSAGALMSTAADMERFMHFIFDGEGAGILGRASFDEMTRRQNGHVLLDGDFPMGLGYWLVRPFATGDLFASHGGDLPPFHTMLVTVPERRIGVFLAANSSGAASALIPLAVEMVRKLYSWQTGTPVMDPPLPARVRLPEASLARLQGTYASPMGLIEVKARRGRLLARMQGLPLEIVPRADGIWTAELRVLSLVSIRLPQLSPLRLSFFEKDGREYVRVTAMGMLAGVGERFTPSAVPDTWRSRAGSYAIVRQGDNAAYRWPQDIRLGFDPARGMVLTYRFAGLVVVDALETRCASCAVIRGLGTGLGDAITAREEAGSVFLEWSGLLLKKQ